MEERREELKRLLAGRRLGQVQAKPRSGLTTMAALTLTSKLVAPEQWSLAKGGSSPEPASIPAVDSSQTEQTTQQPAVSSVVSEASASAHPAGFALQAGNELGGSCARDGRAAAPTAALDLWPTSPLFHGAAAADAVVDAALEVMENYVEDWP